MLKRSGSKKPLTFAVRYFLEHYKEAAESMTVEAAVTEYTDEKSKEFERGLISRRQERAIRIEMDKFKGFFNERVVTAGGTFRQKLAQALAGRGIDLNVGVETTSFAQALEALRTGTFAAILPEFANTHLSERQFAAIRLPELKSASRTLVLARRKQREDLHRVSKIMTTTLI